MIKHFCKFDESGRIIASYLNDGMPYTENDLLEMGCIEVSEEDFILYMENGGNKYIRNKSGNPIIRSGYYDDQKSFWKNIIKEKYDKERIRIGALILVADSEEEIENLKQEKDILAKNYKGDFEKVEQGINPLEKVDN